MVSSILPGSHRTIALQALSATCCERKVMSKTLAICTIPPSQPLMDFLEKNNIRAALFLPQFIVIDDGLIYFRTSLDDVNWRAELLTTHPSLIPGLVIEVIDE